MGNTTQLMLAQCKSDVSFEKITTVNANSSDLDCMLGTIDESVLHTENMELEKM